MSVPPAPQPYGGHPQQPYGGQPQQPYGGHPQQPYGGQPHGYGAPPPVPGGAPHPGAAIALTTKFLPLAFFYYLVKPKVSIDGYPVAAEWGRTVIPVPPGDHRVDVHTPYILPPRIGPADTVVSVAPGQTLELEYRSPVVAFSRGSLGAPPQKYNGVPVLIALLAIVVVFGLCACVLPLLGASTSS
ncbi:hypothetical protein ACNTMW_30115 [Planosporangium sp. 12N6]|uniref:hypothetical protein n=1 Tax=Planosporangium spinosum TaxID=3402278 RepID=UPI003CF56075